METFISTNKKSIADEMLKNYSTTLMDNVMNGFKNVVKGSDEEIEKHINYLSKALHDNFLNLSEKNESKRREEKKNQEIEEKKKQLEESRRREEESKRREEALKRERDIIDEQLQESKRMNEQLYTTTIALIEEMREKNNILGQFVKTVGTFVMGCIG